MTPAILAALLPLAGQRGWSSATLAAALVAAGEDPVLLPSHFPRGPLGAIAEWSSAADRAMVTAAQAEDIASLRTPARIRRLVELRLAQVAPYKPALRTALAHLALPWHLPAATAMAARTTDTMWRAAGDRSADFSWYTRRASLGAVYGSTLAFWTRDESPELAPAMAFLDRRLENLARITRGKRR